MFSSCEGKCGEYQECSSVVIVLFSMTVCMIDNHVQLTGVVKGWAPCGRSRKTVSSDDGF